MRRIFSTSVRNWSPNHFTYTLVYCRWLSCHVESLPALQQLRRRICSTSVKIWSHIISQIHLGYCRWLSCRVESLPALQHLRRRIYSTSMRVWRHIISQIHLDYCRWLSCHVESLPALQQRMRRICSTSVRNWRPSWSTRGSGHGQTSGTTTHRDGSSTTGNSKYGNITVDVSTSLSLFISLPVHLYGSHTQPS